MPPVKNVLSKVKQVWKATGKLFANVGYQWKPTGKKFTLGEHCPLTRFTKSKVVPLQQPEHVSSSEIVITERFSNTTQKPLTRYKRRNKKEKIISTGIPTIAKTHKIDDPVVQIVLWYLDSGCSKYMKGNRSRLKNFIKKFIGTVIYENDHFGAIMGYGDYVIGDSVISRVYYVEGLGHNLFFIGQFCDLDHEVAFRKHSCYVRDVDGVELLKGNRGSNLYTISVEDMMKSSSICLLSKASKKKSWLWHRRLNHLNFDTINDLARGLPRLKFKKDHLCSACQLGKSKKLLLTFLDNLWTFDQAEKMVEENVLAPTRTDAQLVPIKARLPIGKSNLLMDLQKMQNNPIFRGRHNIHRRPQSLVHITADDYPLNNLKFVSKGGVDEVFRMPIPKDMITDDIWNSEYYKKYMEMVARKPRKPTTITGEEVERRRNLQAYSFKENLQGKEVRQAPVGGVVIREHDSSITRKLPDVEGKGKRRTPVTQDVSTGPSAQPQDDTSVNVVHDTSSPADSTNDAETTADMEQSNNETRDSECQAGSDPGKTPESRPPPELELKEEDQAGSDPGQSHVAQAGPNPEPMHEDFIATVYPEDKKTQAHASRVYKVEHHDLYSKIDKQVNEVVKEVVRTALQALLHHTNLYEALEVSMQCENNDELHATLTKSSKRPRDDQDPPPPPPKDSDRMIRDIVHTYIATLIQILTECP
ncbi:integrase, catalytic region, zinc finger, CCHC-type containing protein [Tanacetum coccineum]